MKPRSGTRGGRRRKRIVWARWSNQRLLGVRICDLGVDWRGTWLERRVRAVEQELDRRGLRLRPHVWLSQEWFSPDGVPGVAIPFYLAHPRLMRLERSKLLEVEGGTREECTRILRHEFGHAIQHAFQLQRRRGYQQLFGRSSKRYPEHYRPNPASRRYVHHLRLNYAQSHPDEDFAETFAVWLQPRAVWRKRYAGWPALRKLEYVDRLMSELRGEIPPVRTRRQVEPVRRLRIRLRDYYENKRRRYAVSYPDVYDRDLRRIFSDDRRHQKRELASTFLRRNRSRIRQIVSRWTGEYEFTLEQVLNEIIGRCRELKLRAGGPERQLVVDFAVLLTVNTMQSLYVRRSWIAL